MEVEGEEVTAGNEDDTVAEADDEGSEVGAAFEDAKGDYRVDGEFVFDEEEDADYDQAEDDEANYGCGGPWEGESAEGETE